MASSSCPRRRLRLGLVTLACLLPALNVWTQQSAVPPTLDSVFGESIDVRVVNLEVVVTDREGRRVTGLTPEDLQLLVDGDEVPIEFFSEIRQGVAVVAEDLPAATPAPAGEIVPTQYLVFVDDIFTLKRDRDRVVSALAEQVAALRPGDQMAVAAYSQRSGLEVLTSWTDSQADLGALVRAIAERPAKGLLRFSAYGIGGHPLVTGTGTANFSLVSRDGADGSAYRYRSGNESWLGRLLTAAEATMRALPSPPGRRVMVMLSGGWNLYNTLSFGSDYLIDPTSFGRVFGPLTDTANRLGYTLYPVDVAGLVTTFGADVAGASSSGVSPFERNRRLDDNLRFLATATGGEAMLDRARHDAFERIVADTESYYWLGFTPPFERNNRSYRLRVKTRQRGLDVRTRESFRDLSSEIENILMVESALMVDGLDADHLVEVVSGPPRDGRRRSMEVPVEVTIPLDEVTAVPTADGWWVRLDVFLTAKDARGRRSEVLAVPVALKRTQEPRAGEVARYRTEVRMRRQPHQVLVAVHDPLARRNLFGRARVEP